jgi:hypothetical protein
MILARNLKLATFLMLQVWILIFDDLVKSLKSVTPEKAGVQNLLILLDSRSPLSRGQALRE